MRHCVWVHLTAALNFTVPTGNFGDIYAGYLARDQMGLPIQKLIIASNRNDILARCIATSEYRIAGVNASLSPSMDIEISAAISSGCCLTCSRAMAQR